MDYAYEITKIKKQLDILNKSLLQSQRNNVPVTAKADAASAKVPQVDANTEGVEQNSGDIITTQEGLAETYEEMNSSVIEVEEALAEVYEMIINQN